MSIVVDFSTAAEARVIQHISSIYSNGLHHWRCTTSSGIHHLPHRSIRCDTVFQDLEIHHSQLIIWTAITGNRNHNLEMSTARTKAQSREPAYSQARWKQC